RESGVLRDHQRRKPARTRAHGWSVFQAAAGRIEGSSRSERGSWRGADACGRIDDSRQRNRKAASSGGFHFQLHARDSTSAFASVYHHGKANRQIHPSAPTGPRSAKARNGLIWTKQKSSAHELRTRDTIFKFERTG